MAENDGFRGAVKALSPVWLQEGDGEKYMYAPGQGLDAVQEKFVQAVHAWMPGRGTPTALPAIGSDRLIRQGLTEPVESYARRLQLAFESWQRAGSPWAVLSQVLGYLLAVTPAARTVSSSYTSTGAVSRTIWNLYAAGQNPDYPPTHGLNSVGEWDWDSLSPTSGSWGWWRWYLVIEAVAPNDWTAPAPKWGATGVKWGGYSGSWGTTSSSLVGKSIKMLIAQWGSSVCDWVVISFDATAFRPGAATMPDGYYGRWSKLVGGVYVRSRSASGRYFKGQ